MEDGSSVPNVIHNRLGQDWVDLIVEIRTEYQITALRLSRYLNMPRSTVSAVLQREGISQFKQLAPKEPVAHFKDGDPGEMLHININKLGRFWRPSHRVTGDSSKDSTGGRLGVRSRMCG